MRGSTRITGSDEGRTFGRRAAPVRTGAVRGGYLLWLLQRLTAAVLLIGLLVHLVVTHVFNIGELSFETSGARLGSALYVGLDFLLLGTGLFHGLNGVRMVLLDYDVFARRRLTLDVLLLSVGVAVFLYGVWALWPWLAAPPGP